MKNRSDISTKRILFYWEMDNRGEKYQYKIKTNANSQLKYKYWVQKKL